MSDSVQPHRRQPTRLPHPWDSPGKNTGVGCHFLLQCMKVKSESGDAQSCLTSRDPMDCSPPGSSIHGIFQARVLEWGAIAFSGWMYKCVLFLIFCSTKSTNLLNFFLTWVIWFSLINNHLWMLQLPGLCCKNSYISWLLALPLQSILSELAEMLCPGLKSSTLSAK